MRPIRVGFVVLILGSPIAIGSAAPPPPGVDSPMSWLKPWEVPMKAPCTCDDLRKRLDEAERMRDAYARAFRGDPIRFKSGLDRFIEKEMGWDDGSAKAQGKPEDETTTQQEREAARENCKYCAWICDVSIQKVHEGYHKWFREQYQGQYFNFVTVSELMTISQRTFVKYIELGEIGAHQAEATFLRETLAEMERRGLCTGLLGTPTMDQREARWKEADVEVRFHMELPLSGSPL